MNICEQVVACAAALIFSESMPALVAGTLYGCLARDTDSFSNYFATHPSSTASCISRKLELEAELTPEGTHSETLNSILTAVQNACH